MNRSTRIVLGTLAVVVLAGIGFLIQRKLTAHPASVSAPFTGRAEGAAQYLRSARNYQASLKTQSEAVSPDFSKECIDYFGSLEQLNLLDASQTGEKTTYQLLPTRPDKCTWKDALLDRLESEFAENCRPAANQSAALSDECSEKLFFMRAGITRLLLKNKPIGEITDMHQLVDLLFSEFVAGAPGGAPDFSRIREASDRMLELNPNLYVAAKTSAYSGAIEGMLGAKNGSLTPDAQEALWKKSEQEVRRAEELNPNDASLEDAKAAIATRGFDPDKTLDYGNQAVAQRPNDARGYFLRSYAEWKKNLRADSIRDLRRALELNPQESGYSKILSEIIKPGATLDSFQGQFRFAVSNDDFKG